MAMANGGLPAGIKAITTGKTTIQSDTDKIPITHNLGYLPDLIFLQIEDIDYDLIPGGSCIETTHIRTMYQTPPNETENSYHYLYAYKHGTSLNMIFGQSTSTGLNATTTTAEVVRGAQQWKALDTNGNTITYRWYAIKFE